MLALCLGAILAYPVRWRTRLVGAGVGLALILALNTLRIGTLGRLAASPSLFDAFHVYVWPAVLSLAVAGYVFAWMRLADRQRQAGSAAAPGAGDRRGARGAPGISAHAPLRPPRGGLAPDLHRRRPALPRRAPAS